MQSVHIHTSFSSLVILLVMVRQPQNQEHYLFGKEDNGKQLRAYKSYLGGSERIEVLSAFSC